MKISDVSVSNAVSSTMNVKNSDSIESGNGVDKSGQQQDMKSKQMVDDKGKDDQVVINDEMLEKAVEQANKSLQGYNRYIERSVHEKTKAIMYVMKDSKTDEVIREFPPKKIQDMIAKMWELAGLFVDEKA